MITVTPSFFSDFKCIAGACPDSCCRGWEVDADDESLRYYKSLKGDSDIRKRIDSVLDKDEFGNTIFRLTDKKRCPFLNSKNLCDMHIEIGGEHTPYTCRMFPSFINDFGGTREMGISFSCPAASDMMWNLKEPMSFVSEVNDMPPQINEIDAQLYYYLKKSRDKAFSIAQNRNRSVSARLVDLLDFGTKLQKELDDYADFDDDTDFFDVFKNPELINTEWLERVNNGKITLVSDGIYNENILCYFIFRYFLTAVYDYDVLSKIKMAVLGVLIVTYFGEDSWTIHLWSKETEHSQYNMDRYKRLLRRCKALTTDNLKKLILKPNGKYLERL